LSCGIDAKDADDIVGVFVGEVRGSIAVNLLGNLGGSWGDVLVADFALRPLHFRAFSMESHSK